MRLKTRRPQIYLWWTAGCSSLDEAAISNSSYAMFFSLLSLTTAAVIGCRMLALCEIKLPISATPSIVRSHFVMVRFMMIHFYDPCPVRPSTPDLWCITVVTQVFFLYLVRFQLFSGVLVFLLFYFRAVHFKLTVIFLAMSSHQKERLSCFANRSEKNKEDFHP